MKDHTEDVKEQGRGK